MVAKEMPMLILHEGGETRREWGLNKEVITIGREESNDIVLPDRLVSRRHARIQRRGERYVLQDCSSKNGTFVNGRQLIEPYVLQDGDEIQIALRFRLFFVDAEATAPLFFEDRGGLRLDKGAKRVWVRGQELVPPLSSAQYRLLELLYDRMGKVCSRDEIVQAVWPEAVEEGVSEQAIDALVRRLRNRIGEVDPSHQYIVTVRGHGFRLDNAL
ncbi:MAG TPA: FHA domain-containing protein [Anaerolineae bacterium]|nr:FHA domain-containing protein [Anaerolineae bacterium]